MTDLYTIMEPFLFAIFGAAALALLYLSVIGIWKGLRAPQARMMVAAVCILFSIGVFVYNIARDEDSLQEQEQISDLMQGVEGAILSGQAPAAAAILHEQSGKLDEGANYTWVRHYDQAMTALDKLDSKNPATRAAEDRAK